MKKFLYLFSLCILTFTCTNREVQLPETDSSAIIEVNDISPIYIFYEEENGAADFNRNNMIGTTNWLVNVDKRLTLKNVLEHLQFLQNKRGKDGMHKNELARNYFSCSNPGIQNLAFIDFTGVQYRDQSILEYIRTQPQSDSLTSRVFINYKNERSIDIGKNLSIETIEKEAFLEGLTRIINRDELMDELYLNFNADLTFQEYIWLKSELLKLNDSLVKVSKDEFIYK